MSSGLQTVPGRSADRRDVVVVEDHALVRQVVYVGYLPRCIRYLPVNRLPLVGVQIGKR